MLLASKNCAPNLTTLVLFDLRIVNRDPNTSSVTLNFPLLETFRARRSKWLNVKSVELYAPLLATFFSEGSNLEKEYDYTFEIHAPRLANFNGGGCIPEKFNVIYRSSIVSADFYSDYDFGNLVLRENIGLRVGKMFNEFINLLELKITTPEALSPPGTHLRPHVKLRELEFESCSNAEQLLALLHASPSLKLLRINVCECIDYDYEGITVVPSCILTRLEEIIFTGFLCETRHYNLAKFLIEKGEKLKKITFKGEPYSPKKRSEVKDYISALLTLCLSVMHETNQPRQCYISISLHYHVFVICYFCLCDW